MNRNLVSKLQLVVLAFGILAWPMAVSGDEAQGGSLADIHKILLEAAGYQSDTPPTPDQQKELLTKALKMIEHLPHVYHGRLKVAARSIDAALSELSTGDTAHKVKGDIYDADDSIKSLM